MPATRYLQTPEGIDIAYRIHEGGPVDLVIVPGFAGAMEIFWELPSVQRFYEGLSTFARVLEFDPRGSGLSGRSGAAPTLEARTRDLGTVMDGLGFGEVALFAEGDGAAVASMFAATDPERISSIVLRDPQVRTTWAEDFPWGMRPEEASDWEAKERELWNTPDPTPELIEEAGWVFGEDAREAPELGRWVARYCRYMMTPSEFRSFSDAWLETDARHVLGSVQAPTLILHGKENDEIRGLFSAIQAMIPGADRQELPDARPLSYMARNVDAIVDAIATHLRVERPRRQSDRVLATVLFTDIVDSTRRAADLGDQRWRQLLAQHDAIARSALDRFDGRYVHTTGDGMLATFDGPARAVRCARDLAGAVMGLGLRIRSGVHTGEVELAGDDVQGLAVHIGARVAALAGPDEVWASSTVKDLTAGSGLTFEDAGEHELKGVPDTWRLYRVVT